MTESSHGTVDGGWSRAVDRDASAGDVMVAGARTLANKHHPDIGGSTQTIQAINAVADWRKPQEP